MKYLRKGSIPLYLPLEQKFRKYIEKFKEVITRQSFPFTSQVTYDESGNPEYDRAVDSDILRNVLKNYYTNGVFPNPSTNFQVVAYEGMQVVVRPGACIIEGATAYETESRTLVVQAAESTDRIDTVVLRLNDNIDYRNIDLYVVKGTSSSEAPALTRTGGVYEIGLANLYISSNSTTITTERITDTRLDAERCGYSMPIQQIDTTALYDQLQAQVDANIELIQRAIDGTESQHLQSQIDVLSSDMTKAQESIEQHTQDISDLNNSLDIVRSHVGMIVQSTTLDTEAKVIAIYGGTAWSKIEGRFLLGASSSYKVNSTGGEAAHTLTVSEIPSHNHKHTASGQNCASGYGLQSGSASYAGSVALYNDNNHYTEATGGGASHNNMPPYKSVYIWERTE